MIRSATRIFLSFVSAVLLTGFFLTPARAQAPTLTAKFGIAGHYRPGGWCLVTVTVQNPGADPVSGQLQVLTASDSGRGPYGRPNRSNASSVVFACPVSVSGGSAAPQTFPLYLRGVDPGQSDLTVQLVGGRERGDGRILASINNQNQNTAQAFTGVPVGTNDSLAVGFGGDPGAFMFLNSRRLPVSANPQPNRNNGSFNNGNINAGNMNSGMQATLQVAAASAADLPDKAAGYDGVSAFLLRGDAPVEAMTEAQGNALKGWVAAGGHLIVCGGPDPTRFGSAFYEGLLPATAGSSGVSGAMTLTPKPLPGVRVLQSAPGGAAQIVSGPYGAGTVALTSFDPSLTASQSAAASQSASSFTLPTVWQTLLFSRRDPLASVLSVTASREENYNAIYYGSGPPLLSEAVMRGPSLDAPGASVIAIFLIVYLLVLVPVNYFVLKRFDRKELAWATIPALVFLFAAGTFAVGYAAKGGSVFVNRAALVETSAGQQQAGVYSELGLFSPHRTSYDIGLSGDNLLAAVPNPGLNYGSQNGDSSQGSGPAQFVETSSGVSLPNTPVNMWAMRAFDTQSTVSLGGTVDCSLADKNGAVSGNVVNHTPYPLTDCAIWYAGGWTKIGTLAAGATLALPSGVGVGSPQAAFPASAQIADSQSSIRDRMHAALGDYFRSLSQGSMNNNYYGGPPLPAYAPASGEAVLAGWSSDPKLAGPSPHVDGETVTENDISLVVVHLPVAGAPQPAAAQSNSPAEFGVTTRGLAAYQTAQDTRTFAAGNSGQFAGRAMHLRGTVSTFVQPRTSQGAILCFVPDVSQQGVTALLPFSSGRRDPAVLALLGREIVVTGTLTQVNGKPQIVVSQPGQLQVVQ